MPAVKQLTAAEMAIIRSRQTEQGMKTLGNIIELGYNNPLINAHLSLHIARPMLFTLQDALIGMVCGLAAENERMFQDAPRAAENATERKP